MIMVENLEKKLADFAEQHGYILTRQSAGVIKGLKAMKKMHGEYYCPCRIQKIKDTICPCKFVHDDIKKEGHCHCNLFMKVA